MNLVKEINEELRSRRADEEVSSRSYQDPSLASLGKTPDYLQVFKMQNELEQRRT